MNRDAHDLTRVLVAGAGVGGLEAILTLTELADEYVDITLLAPDSEFRYRQLAVVTPFEHLHPEGFNVDEITRELGVRHHRGLLERVDLERSRVLTKGGNEIEFDALLIAVGVESEPAIPGALTYRGSEDARAFRDLLAAVDAGSVRRITFAVPSRAAWSLPLYELALFTAERARTHGDVGIDLVTPESAPLAIFGREVSVAVARLLDDSQIGFEGRRSATAYRDGLLELDGGESRPADFVVSAAVPRPPAISGLERDAKGFIRTDAFGRVPGSDVIFAAGDATWYPVKQGGLAAQQADAAAGAIAELAGSGVVAKPFAPVLRGALLTPWGPRYLRRQADASTISRTILWWPPTKVAGSRLGPYLAARSSGQRGAVERFHDVEAVPGDRPLAHRSGHGDAFALALSSAQAAADRREFRRAVGWLQVAEDLELRLPASFQTKRIAWRELAEQRPDSPLTRAV